MEQRVYNFNPGPAALPVEALRKAQKELLSYEGTGLSILETSHRSPEFSDLLSEAESSVRELLSVPKEYAVLFLGGGASLQFYMAPLNLLGEGETADYVDTGSWSRKAIKEAKRVGQVNIAASASEEGYRRIPGQRELELTPGASYVHLTSNNTIYGTRWSGFPSSNGVLLASDMSSDILSRPVDISRFCVIYAGAQKNLGPAGVTLVIVRKDSIGRTGRDLPTMLDYATHVEKKSAFNTPPCFAIYFMKLVLDWVKEQGGVEAMEKRAREKAGLLYRAIDESGGFYKGTVSKDSRSLMNVTFLLEKEDLAQAFLEEAKEAGLVGLKGHRSVGGLRASLYNSVEVEAVEKLVEFMHRFQANH